MIFVVSCSDTTNLVEAKSPNYTVIHTDPISYLNSIRSISHLNTLKKNQKLDISALNHAKYTISNNSESHFEAEDMIGFTGVTPTHRAFYAGYNSPVSENIAINANDAISSITSLMSAIYHRFGFLDPTINEIGWAQFGDDKNFVYNMGNSNLENFCASGISDSGYGKYYGDFCKNKNLRISEQKYNSFKNLNYTNYIYYPNSEFSKAFFSHEIPDPMPECKITANPVSIEFSSFNDPVTMKEFKIYDNGKELSNTKILTSQNDPNRQFSKFQYAIFALSPFEFEKEYEAKFVYLENGKDKEISWKFKTLPPNNPYFTVKDGESLALEPDKWYEIFFYPSNCNDVFLKYNLSYRFMKKPEILTTDTNTIKIKLSGIKGSKLIIKTDNGKTINLVLTKSSAGASIFDFKLVIIGGFILFLAIIILLKSRR